jgi:hypothetical protein
MTNKINIKIILVTLLLLKTVYTDDITNNATQNTIPKLDTLGDDYEKNIDFEKQADLLNGNTLNENLYNEKVKEDEEEVGTIPEEQSSEDHIKKEEKEEEVGTIPEVQSSEDHNKNNDLQLDNIDEDNEAEDNLAKNAFLFILMILVIFIFAFIYNLIKCYSKPEPTKQLKEDNYSRELHNTSVDDTVLDLAS